MTGKRRRQQSPITRLARGQACLIRIPQACNANPETTCSCHFRLPGLSGAGFIPDALFIAFGCSGCHAWVDSHHDDETQLAFSHGVFRTQARLMEMGVIKLEARCQST
jgi:putative nuclease YbcO-like protein